MKKYQLALNLMAALLFLTLTAACHDANDEPPTPDKPDKPVITEKTAYDVLESLVETTLPSEDFSNVKVKYYHYIEQADYSASYDLFDPESNPTQGQPLRLSNLTDDSVVLETWCGNTSLSSINPSIGQDVNLPVPNLILTGKSEPSKIKLSVEEKDWGLFMSGQYEDTDKTILIRGYLKNANTEILYKFDGKKPCELSFIVTYSLKNVADILNNISTYWTPLSSECDYENKTIVSSPFIFDTTDEKTSELLNSLQIALNTPALKLSQYGFGPENDYVVSIATFYKMLFYGTYFSHAIMAPYYPCAGAIKKEGLLFARTEDFPCGTFIYFNSGSDEVKFYVNVAKLLKIRMSNTFQYWPDVDILENVSFPLKDSKTISMLGNIAVALGNYSVDGITTKLTLTPGEVDKYGYRYDFLQIHITQPEVSRRLTGVMINTLLEPENNKRITDYWSRQGMSEADILKLNSDLQSLKATTSTFNLGFVSKGDGSGEIAFFHPDATDLYKLMRGGTLPF